MADLHDAVAQEVCREAGLSPHDSGRKKITEILRREYGKDSLSPLEAGQMLTICELEKKVAVAVAALEWFEAQLEDKVLVRGTEQDNDSGWGLRMLRFGQGLQEALATLAKLKAAPVPDERIPREDIAGLLNACGRARELVATGKTPGVMTVPKEYRDGVVADLDRMMGIVKAKIEAGK